MSAVRFVYRKLDTGSKQLQKTVYTKTTKRLIALYIILQTNSKIPINRKYIARVEICQDARNGSP